MDIRREESQLESVGSYSRLVLNNRGEVELMVGLTSGHLVRCRGLETNGLKDRVLVSDGGL